MYIAFACPGYFDANECNKRGTCNRPGQVCVCESGYVVDSAGTCVDRNEVLSVFLFYLPPPSLSLLFISFWPYHWVYLTFFSSHKCSAQYIGAYCPGGTCQNFDGGYNCIQLSVSVVLFFYEMIVICGKMQALWKLTFPFYRPLALSYARMEMMVFWLTPLAHPTGAYKVSSSLLHSIPATCFSLMATCRSWFSLNANIHSL